MEEIEALRNYLENEDVVSLAYLFGSRAEGEAGPRSDYDIGVLVQSPSPRLRYRLSYEIGRVLNADRIDLVLLNKAPVELAYSIITQGRRVYQQSLAARVEFEARVLSLYGDYLPVLRRQRREIVEGRHYAAGIHRNREAFRRTERTLAALRAAQGEAAV